MKGRSIRKVENRRARRFRNRGNLLSPADSVLIYAENGVEFVRKPLELTNGFNRVFGCKINIQKSILQIV